MKPIKFKVKKLYDIQRDRYSRLYTKEGKLWGTFAVDLQGTYKYEEPIPILAYQLIPCEDYSRDECLTKRIDNLVLQSCYVLSFCDHDPLQPIVIPAEHFESFKQAVIEYNREYCEHSDIHVLDDFYRWNLQQNLEFERNGVDTIHLNNRIEKYKQTLEPNYFEEVSNE